MPSARCSAATVMPRGSAGALAAVLADVPPEAAIAPPLSASDAPSTARPARRPRILRSFRVAAERGRAPGRVRERLREGRLVAGEPLQRVVAGRAVRGEERPVGGLEREQ